ncbi:hypothetical protein [Nocardia amamiensis]|uniref:hypothetical protein n=1 Tax=Nocardia amamiensis TaxID=404578 RepID=UPI0008360DFF|nr:hypothetical protein [Nocardia amamiensis]
MNEWPDWITQLPQITPAFPAQGYLLAGAHGQLVFWQFRAETVVPTHQHGPQIGIVVAGHIELRTDTDTTRTLAAGEMFTLTDQQPHAATVAANTLVLEVFADADRYRPTETAGRP